MQRKCFCATKMLQFIKAHGKTAIPGEADKHLLRLREESCNFFTSRFSQVRKLNVKVNNNVAPPARIFRIRQTFRGNMSNSGWIYHVEYFQRDSALAKCWHTDRHSAE